MTPKQIEIVQSTFTKVAPIVEIAADLFYARLFELDPQLKAMFKGDMKRQGMTPHFTTVGQALIDTLAKGLGADFTPEARDAWLAACSLLSTVMKAGAAEATPIAQAA